jgi:hypothetical protein
LEAQKAEHADKVKREHEANAVQLEEAKARQVAETEQKNMELEMLDEKEKALHEEINEYKKIIEENM